MRNEMRHATRALKAQLISNPVVVSDLLGMRCSAANQSVIISARISAAKRPNLPLTDPLAAPTGMVMGRGFVEAAGWPPGICAFREAVGRPNQQ
jgi:hypothetical protein